MAGDAERDVAPFRPGPHGRARIWAIEGDDARQRSDRLATEEPLELRLISGRERRTLAVTMRTPGADFELAGGFLCSEGLIGRAEDIRRLSYCVDRDLDEQQRYNIVNVELAAGTLPDLRHLERHFYVSSACGVCGKASLEALELRGCSAPSSDVRLEPRVLYSLPERLREGQGVFDSTGGLHAAALFDARGRLLAVREDVGRHNATDKVIGWALLQRMLPLSDLVLMVSGRASFEIMQKALAAGLGVVCAVSAPSSLAVDVARAFGMTLIGFLRQQRFNVYAGVERVALPERSLSGSR